MKGKTPRVNTGRSINVFKNGTIARKKFHKGWYEGEITKYNLAEK